MSNRYKGGVISATPPTTTGGEDGTASGAWTLEQQAQLQAAGLWPAQPTGPWIEDCFSTYLYTGTGAAQTITNGINLSGKGGLVWIKSRVYAQSHGLFDTVRGVEKSISSNSTSAQLTQTRSLTAFGTSGFSLGTDDIYGNVNFSGVPYASWTFREQPKFFDIVTWTGNGVGGRQIAHNLGSVPGCLMVKVLSEEGGWSVWHRAIPGDTNQTGYLSLNSTQEAELNKTNVWAANGITSTYFTASTDSPSNINGSGQTYVAYLFAHNAGGFGLTGTDNVISCGSYTGNGTSENNITLGYEPQWVLIKDTTTAYKWLLMDNMRGLSMGTSSAVLSPNSSDAETANGAIQPTATGFTLTGGGGFLNGSGDNYIYIAIRRGPMKVPTSGTSVFKPNARTGNGSTQTVSGLSFSPDLWMTKNRGNTQNNWSFDRLRGPNQPLSSNLTDDEATNTSNYFGGSPIFTPTNTGFTTIGQSQVNTNSGSYIDWLFGRAPSFFDEVCYTGTGASSQVLTHNLTVTPQLTIFKKRSASNPWDVVYGNTSYLQLNDTLQAFPDTSIAATATTITAPLGAGNGLNASGATYVAYLFATCAGVSKVGSYTGTGTTLQVNCGFTAGSRFVMIKRTDSTGDWYVWDSARGIVAGNDPYLLLNSTAAEVTNTDYVDTYSAGFEISSTAPAAINANGGTFIFLAIA